MILAVVALVLAVLNLSCCVYLYFELQRRVLGSAIQQQLQSSSEELSKTYAKSVREIETEWDDMYQKFSRLAGRMDRQKALQNPPAQETVQEQPRVTRGDLLRNRKRGHNV